MPFENQEKANRLQRELGVLTNQQLANTILAAAKRLNAGDYNTAPAKEVPAPKTGFAQLLSVFDAVRFKKTAAAPVHDAQADSDTVAAGLFQMSTRTINNSYNRSDVFLGPIIKAVINADDLSDGKAAASLMRYVTLPDALPVAAVGLGKNVNPFH